MVKGASPKCCHSNENLIAGLQCVVDKVDAMLGSYGYQADVRTASVVQDEFPSGMLARGTYNVKSRVTDIDGEVWAGTFL